ncbi:HAD domain-containing protein [Undibacterium sp. Tian12W]|uniref:HAD domain-containing protein n=1 Tax=Undibacterium sp. Tian12W TaxID=3413054 RepID=UPI003BF0F836
MILFLDFDGVLHPEPCFDKPQLFSCLPRLEAVLRDFPTVLIVISSTWRENRSITELRSFFSSDIGARIIGATPARKDIPDIIEVIGYQRHAEIEGWLRLSGEPWKDWVAIDDKSYLFKPFLRNLIKTDPARGLDEHAEIVLRQYLAKALA